MKFGNNVKGSVTAKSYEKWTEITSLCYGLHTKIKNTTGGTSNRVVGNTKFSTLRLFKMADNSSVPLFTLGCNKKVTPEVTIHKVHSGKNNLVVHESYILKNVIVSDYLEQVTSEGEAPIEGIQLSFTEIEKAYTPIDETHNAKAAIRAGYNIAKATVS